jgi:hypothetical protein
MKKIILVAFLAVVPFQNLIAQEKSDIELLSSGKWHFDYFESNNLKMEIPDEMRGDWTIFHSDGKLESMENGKKYDGKWEFDKSNKNIIVEDIEGQQILNLILINEKKLVFGVEEMGMKVKMAFKK